jgi:predicted flap endonuclease-1-like 5' DNA nuclease
MEAQVQKQNGLRSARGFSLSEIRKTGLNIYQARKLGVYIDPRRRTLHEFNVKKLEVLIRERQEQLQKEAEKEKEREEKAKKKKVKEKKVKEKPEKKKKEVGKKEEAEVRKIEAKGDLTQIKGIGKKRAEELEAAGIATVEELIRADAEKLAEETGFTAEYIKKLKERARTL